MEKLNNLQKLLKINFRNLALIKQAFIHRSYLNEVKKPVSSNERLEFLGDSILSYLVSDYLYQTFPLLPEGELTNLRSSVVKTSTLANIAKSLDLGSYLFFSRGEEEGGGRNNPSLLADTFEALLGAIYLDGKISAVKSILDRFLFPLFPKIMAEKSYKDAKSMFQEFVQEVTKFSPIYKVLHEEGPDHAKKFVVGVYVGRDLWGEGSGKNKHEAEQAAASIALEKWKKREYNR